MPQKARKVKHIMIAKHKFRLEIYLALEGRRDLTWEIFPYNHDASLYAFKIFKTLLLLIISLWLEYSNISLVNTFSSFTPYQNHFYEQLFLNIFDKKYLQNHLYIY